MKKKILKLPPHPILIPNDSTPGRHSRHSAVSGHLLRGSFPTNVKQGYSRGVKNSQQVIYNILFNRFRREAGGRGRGEGWRGWGWGGEGGQEGGEEVGDEGGVGDDQGPTSRDAVRWLFHRRWTETGGGPTPAPAPRRWSRGWLCWEISLARLKKSDAVRHRGASPAINPNSETNLSKP